MKHYVLGFLFDTERKKICLIRKIKPDWQKNFLNGIGGKLEEYEDIEKCMIREFEEETGVNTKEEDWKMFSILRNKSFVVYCFKSFNTIYLSQVKTIEEEEIIVKNLDDVFSDKIIKNLSYLINMALDDDLDFVEIEYKNE